MRHNKNRNAQRNDRNQYHGSDYQNQNYRKNYQGSEYNRGSEFNSYNAQPYNQYGQSGRGEDYGYETYNFNEPHPTRDNSDYNLGQSSTPWLRRDENKSRKGEHYGKSPKGYSRSDERIKEEVCEALMRQGDIDPSDIQVEVKDGVVILEGSVSSRQDKYRLEHAIENVLSVQDIDNNLRLSKAGGRDTSTQDEERMIAGNNNPGSGKGSNLSSIKNKNYMSR